MGTPPRVPRVTAAVDRVDRRTGLPELATWAHVIRDPAGRPLRVSADWWPHLHARNQFGGDGVAMLRALARAAGVPRLYVQSPDTGEPLELRAYLAGLQTGDYWLTGPAPLQLVIAFPRPRLSGIERWRETHAAQAWQRCLLDLPVQQAVVRIAGEPPAVVRIVDVPTPRIERARCERFLAASRAANGQSAAEILATHQARQAQMQRLMRGEPAHDAEVEDGSVW